MVKNYSIIALICLLVFSPSLAYSIESICPGGSNPDPNIVFCDDFDDGTWLSNPAWSASPWCDGGEAGTTDPAKVFSGGGAITSGTRMYAIENYYSCGYGDIPITGLTDEAYYRIYIKFSPGYIFGDVTDKGMYIEGPGWNMKTEYNRWDDHMAGFDSYAMEPEYNSHLYQNQGNNIQFQTGKWYLVEFHIKLNTGDNFNGIYELWVDDASVPITQQTLRASYNNARMLKTSEGDTRLINRLFLVAQNQVNAVPSGSRAQWMAWDQLVVSKGRIGPIGQGQYTSLIMKTPSAPTINGIQ